MEEDDDLAVTLQIIEATGFNIRNESILIKASLGGSVLETNVATPTDHKTTFNHKLVWQTNRDAVKRMKEENQPIKLECFRVAAENIRESIGLLNIRLRQIPFWNVRQSGTLKPHWYKLYGVPQEYKSQKPELYLCVTIGDPYTTSVLHSNESTEASETRCSKYKELPVLNIFVSQLGLAIQSLNKNNTIKLGNDGDDWRKFTVKINIKHAEQLEHLLTLSATNRRSDFAIEYRLFGERCVDAVPNELTGCYSIDEVITIAIQSTWQNILKYFREIFHIDLHILHNDGVIGSCKLSFGNGLINLPATLEEFENIFASENLTFHYDDYAKIIVADSTNNFDSFLHYSFQVQYVKSNAMPQTNANLSLPVPSDRSRLSCTTPPAINSDNMSSHTEQVIATQEVIGDGFFRDHATIRHDSDKAIPRTFSYSLALIDCTFQRRPSPGIWQFSLHHENADNPMTIRNIEISDLNVDQICFEDLDLKLCFSTYSQRLMDLIQAKSCLLTLKGPKGFHASAELDNANVLAEEKSKGIVLLKNDCGEQVAMAHVSVEICDLGLNFNLRDNNNVMRGRNDFSTKQSTVLFDENLAYKVVEELENWKQCQQQAVLMDLKRREIALMTRLTNEWHRKRRDEEEKLDKRMKHCDRLTRTLEDAYEALKEHARTDEILEKSIVKSTKQMEKQFAAKTTVFQDRIRALEEEQRKLKKDSENRLKDVENQRDHVIAENEKVMVKLRRMEDTYRNEIAGLKAENQMLMEKLEAVHNSKQMYKEKWAVLVRDVQKVRFENGSVSKENSKTKDVINSARKEFANDQNDLRQIKAQLPNILRQ